MKDIIKLAIDKQDFISKLRKEAKLLHREKPQQSLMMCQDLIAKKHGYLHWHELHTLIKNRLLNLHKNTCITTNSILPTHFYLGIDSLLKKKLYIEADFTRIMINRNEESKSFNFSLFKEILSKNNSQLIYCYDNNSENSSVDLQKYAKEFNIPIYHMDFSNRTSELYFDFENISAGNLTQLLYSLIISINGSGSDMWAGRAVSFISALNMALTFMRNNNEVTLTPQFIIDSMDYNNIIKLSHRDDFPRHVQAALRAYLKSLDGFRSIDNILEHHGHLQMQYMKVLGSMIHEQSYLFEKNSKNHSFNELIQSQKQYVIIAKFDNNQFNYQFCFDLFFEYWKTNWNKFNYNLEKNTTTISSYFCVDGAGEINMNLPSDRLSDNINFIAIDNAENIKLYETKYDSLIKISPLNNGKILINGI